MRTFACGRPFGCSKLLNRVLAHGYGPFPGGLFCALIIGNTPTDGCIRNRFPSVIDGPYAAVKLLPTFPGIMIVFKTRAGGREAALHGVKDLGWDSVEVYRGHGYRRPDIDGVKVADASRWIVFQASAALEGDLKKP